MIEGFSWGNIRSFNGSQNSAFEELVCQLARSETIVNGNRFIRVGAPDAGVEAYWVLEDGREYCWQTKFFDTMGISQWNQLDGSFKTALEKHPNLIKYIVCLPLDRQDPRIPSQNWFMDKWVEKTRGWKEYAAEHGRDVDFVYWGSSELLDLLSLEKHVGRRNFWFNQEEFSDKWFNDKLARSIEALGPRYTVTATP